MGQDAKDLTPDQVRLDRSSLSSQVAEALTRAIMDEQWKPGDVLPSQAELAKSFSVSVVVIREALKSLQARGLVTTSRGRGSVVCEPASVHAYAALKLLVERMKVDVRDLWEVRSLLEPFAAAMAAERITPEQLEGLKELVQPLRKPDVSPEARRTLDLAFHRAIAEATGNRLLCVLTDSVLEITHKVLAVTTEVYGPRGYPLHFEVLDALIAHDPQAASRAMSTHIDRTYNRVGVLPRSERPRISLSRGQSDGLDGVVSSDARNGGS